jgi:hypothetical protein
VLSSPDLEIRTRPHGRTSPRPRVRAARSHNAPERHEDIPLLAGRPRGAGVEGKIKEQLALGLGIRKVARMIPCGTGTVQRVRAMTLAQHHA